MRYALDDRAAKTVTTPLEAANDSETTAEYYSQNQDALQHASVFVESIAEWEISPLIGLGIVGYPPCRLWWVSRGRLKGIKEKPRVHRICVDLARVVLERIFVHCLV
jgi:hypothetical protein